ncbi:Small GTPase superfamily [Carpediemonas membranifera]|uniref:Small GTPase superfamily n=1 Tax=Carpediemonas membranifera TaxID=201153 RepID=A0A8J6E4I0_9EUKA|nr:Small GTPase superfamily [Carpediemonas membranifera]|eukprot:KAG9396971.1 Small GTPase superfamily [Carpediemonas membranifera]
MSMDNSVALKFILVGRWAVGKTSFIRSMMHQEVSDQYKLTVGADMTAVSTTVDGEPVSIYLWDIAGQSRFVGLYPTFFKGAHIAILMYDISPEGRESFDQLEELVGSIRQQTWVQRDDEVEEDIPIFCIANKTDLVKNGTYVTDEEISSKMRDLGVAGHFKTSARLNKGVSDAFDQMVAYAWHFYKDRGLIHSDDDDHIELTQARSSDGGCMGLFGRLLGR